MSGVEWEEVGPDEEGMMVLGHGRVINKEYIPDSVVLALARW